jgi:hypothetical protein
MLLNKKGVRLRNYIARRGLFIRIPVSDKLKHLEPEITLGRSILDRAVLDSVEDDESRDWFDETDPDFLDICEIAYLEPDIVVRYFEKTYIRLTQKETIQNIYKELDEDDR